MYKLGWFSTGRGEGSRRLLTTVMEAIKKGQLRAEVAFVFCNREPGEHPGSDQFCELVKSFGLPLIRLSSRRFRARGPDWREAFDRGVVRLLESYRPDLCVLAGYMLIVSPVLCRRYTMINLHPAAPGGPKGTWQEVIWQLIGQRAKRTGAMMHLVTEALDEGPPVTYCTFSLEGRPFDTLWKEAEGKTVAELQSHFGEELPLFKAIRQWGLAQELPLILATLQAFSEGRVRVKEGKVITASGEEVTGYDLSAEVEAAVGKASEEKGRRNEP